MRIKQGKIWLASLGGGEPGNEAITRVTYYVPNLNVACDSHPDDEVVCDCQSGLIIPAVVHVKGSGGT